jgi:hypothetical protein
MFYTDFNAPIKLLLKGKKKVIGSAKMNGVKI